MMSGVVRWRYSGGVGIADPAFLLIARHTTQDTRHRAEGIGFALCDMFDHQGQFFTIMGASESATVNNLPTRFL